MASYVAPGLQRTPHILKLNGARVQRLVPGDSLPAFVGFFHRIEDPIWIVGQLGDGQSLRAHSTMAYG